MKKVCIFIMVFLLFISAFAHPPMKIHAQFDTEASKLFVEVSHKVKNTQKHFIEIIKVYRNGEEIISQEFDMQLNKDMQKAEYLIPGLNTEDEFKIFAECNMGGKDTETFSVENGEE